MVLELHTVNGQVVTVPNGSRALQQFSSKSGPARIFQVGRQSAVGFCCLEQQSECLSTGEVEEVCCGKFREIISCLLEVKSEALLRP
jgi:hypothetical protein